MCYITIFGSTHFGKSTLMGYIYTHNLDDIQFNHELKEIRKKIQEIGEPYYQDMSLAYFFDTGRDERHKYRNRETTFGTTKRISIIDGINTDIVYIDTPGIDMEWKNRYNGQFMGEYGLYLIEAKKAEELRDLKRSRGDYKELQRRIFSPLFLWDAYKEIKNVIVIISKFDMVSFDMDLYRWLKNEINCFFEDINIIPISINVYNRTGYNIYNEDSKIKGYTGDTLIDTIEKVIPKEQPGNVQMPMFAFFDTFFEKKEVIRVKVLSGQIKKNDSVILGPLKKNGDEKNNNFFLEGRVEKIRKNGINVELLEAGDIGTIKTKTICEKLGKEINRKKLYISKRTTILYGKDTKLQKGNLVQFVILFDKLSIDNKNTLMESKINDQVEIIWLGKNIHTSIVGIQNNGSEFFLTILNRESEPSMFVMAITENGDFLYSTFVIKLKNKHFVCCKLNDIEELNNMSTLHLEFQKPIGYDLSNIIKNYFENCEINLFEDNKYEVIMDAQQIDMLANIRKFVKKYAITKYEVKYKKNMS